MADFLGNILVRMDDAGIGFSQSVYTSIGTQIAPLLNVMLIAYVTYYGLQLIFGTSQITVAAVSARILRMVVIVLLIQNWRYFNDFIYSLLNAPPRH